MSAPIEFDLASEEYAEYLRVSSFHEWCGRNNLSDVERARLWISWEKTPIEFDVSSDEYARFFQGEAFEDWCMRNNVLPNEKPRFWACWKTGFIVGKKIHVDLKLGSAPDATDGLHDTTTRIKKRGAGG